MFDVDGVDFYVVCILYIVFYIFNFIDSGCCSVNLLLFLRGFLFLFRSLKREINLSCWIVDVN